MNDIDTIADMGSKIREKVDNSNLIETLQKMLGNASEMLSTDDGRSKLWKRLQAEMAKNDVTNALIRGGLTSAAIGGVYGAFKKPRTPEEQYQGMLGRIVSNAAKAGMVGALGRGTYQIAKDTLL